MVSYIFFLFLILSSSCYAKVFDSSCFQSFPSKNKNTLNNKKRLSVKEFPYNVIAKYPHDSNAFTQGLTFYQGHLYESTGLLGKSSVRQIDLSTGKVLLKSQLADIYFGEGLTVYHHTLVQMSWKTGKVFFYQPESLKLLKKMVIDKEIWGVTTLDDQLVVSDGSSVLLFIKPDNFKLGKKLEVKLQDKKIGGLNELEYAQGLIYANVWPTACIVIINPQNGRIEGWLNLSALYPKVESTTKHAELNGIAYQADNNHFFITGKYWPVMYEIDIQANEN